MKLFKRILEEVRSLLEHLLLSAIVYVCFCTILYSMHIGADIKVVPKDTTQLEIVQMQYSKQIDKECPYWLLIYYIPAGPCSL